MKVRSNYIDVLVSPKFKLYDFLNVNIGLKRRFPSVLVLQRYDLKSFWGILKNLLDKFSQENQVKYHNHACFELLNLMFMIR
jgi:hypothetical protein